MGLDMYLNRKLYLGEDYEGKRKSKVLNFDTWYGKQFEIDQKTITELTFRQGYWRKANAIHSWFVQNVQGGNDDCREYDVSREKLQELLNIINQILEESELIDGEVCVGTKYEDGKDIKIMEKGKIIKDSTTAEELLPTESGFFFGNTEYNEWYYNDLEKTKEILTDALSKPEDYEFSYRASW